LNFSVFLFAFYFSFFFLLAEPKKLGQQIEEKHVPSQNTITKKTVRLCMHVCVYIIYICMCVIILLFITKCHVLQLELNRNEQCFICFLVLVYFRFAAHKSTTKLIKRTHKKCKI